MRVAAKDLGSVGVFFLSNTVMLWWSNSVWKQYNTDYTVTLNNIQTKQFSWIGEENEGKQLLKFFAYLKWGLRNPATPG